MKEYYETLVKRTFKVLYIYEDNIDNFKKYVESLVDELSGNFEFEQLCQVKFKLNSLLYIELNHGKVRKTVFECVDIISKLIKNWGD